MNKIVVRRTHIDIYDYDLGDNRSLEASLSVWDKTTHRLIPKGYVYDMENRVLMIPRGVSIHKLEMSFNTQAEVDYSFDQYRTFYQEVSLKYKPRSEDQIEAIKFILAMDKYKENERKSMLSLNLNTGKGKTYCAIASMAYLGIASIIISPTLDLLDQWNRFILEYTDINPDKIYKISGSPSIQKLLSRDPATYDIFLCSHATLNSYGNTYGWENVGALFKYLGIGLKYYDECHLNFENMLLIDSYTNTFMSYYLTATMGRSNFSEDIIFQTYFSNVPSINLFNKEEDPHTRYVAIKYNSKPSPLDIEYCKNNYGLDRMKYPGYVVDQPNFENLLYILMEKALAKPGKCLWYIGTNEGILRVKNWIYEHYPEMIGNVGVFTSLVTDPEIKAQQLERKIILSTTKSAGAAIDIKDLVETVNLAEPFKSRVLAQQTLGRTRNNNTIYKDIVDLGFDQTRKFYNFKRPIFKKYATDCSEVILRQEELDSRAQAIKDERKNLWCPIQFMDKCNIE